MDLKLHKNRNESSQILRGALSAGGGVSHVLMWAEDVHRSGKGSEITQNELSLQKAESRPPHPMSVPNAAPSQTSLVGKMETTDLPLRLREPRHPHLPQEGNRKCNLSICGQSKPACWEVFFPCNLRLQKACLFFQRRVRNP